jgi:N-methylhydantoinase A
MVFSVEARYPHQVWEIEVPLSIRRFTTAADVEALCEAFHRTHERIFAVADPDSAVEVVAWRLHVRCSLRTVEMTQARSVAGKSVAPTTRIAYFPPVGELEVPVYRLASLDVGRPVHGPALIESPVTTVVIDPDAVAELLPSGSLVLGPTGGSTWGSAPLEAATSV